MGVRDSPQETGSCTEDSGLKALGQQTGSLSGWIVVTPGSCNSCLAGCPRCLHFLHQSTHHAGQDQLSNILVFFCSGNQARIVSDLSSAVSQGLTLCLKNE